MLLDRGANPNVQNEDGETPLHYAFKAGKRADVAGTVEILVQAGADVNCEDRKGRTPMEMAKRRRKEDREEVLKRMSRL